MSSEFFVRKIRKRLEEEIDEKKNLEDDSHNPLGFLFLADFLIKIRSRLRLQLWPNQSHPGLLVVQLTAQIPLEYKFLQLRCLRPSEYNLPLGQNLHEKQEKKEVMKKSKMI